MKYDEDYDRNTTCYYHQSESSALLNLFKQCTQNKPDGMRPLGRHRRRWENNSKINTTETGCGNVNLINLGQDMAQWPTLENTEINRPNPGVCV